MNTETHIMTTQTADTFELISDLHKDARGFRPSQDWLHNFDSLPYAEQEKIWDRLVVEMDESMTDEDRREAAALADFRALIADTIAAGAADGATALRWLRDADEQRGDDLSYFLWAHGLNSSELLQELGKELGFGYKNGHLQVDV